MPWRTCSLCVLFVGLSPLLMGQTTSRSARLPQYATVDEISLSQADNQVDGKLQIMEDARLTRRLRHRLWGTGDINVSEDPTLSAFEKKPLRNARLRLLTSAGAVAADVPLKRPLAKIGVTKLYGSARPTYLVTVDYSAGFGSYSGPITMPLEVHDGHLQWLEATDRITGKKGKIDLMESLKTTWKIVDSTAGPRKEILKAACRPNLKRPLFRSNSNVQTTDKDFILTYTRFYFDGDRWISAERKKPGFAEFDEGFPSRKLFP